MENLTLQVEQLLENENLPPETRDELESVYTDLTENRITEEIEIARIIDIVGRGNAEIEAIEALVQLDEEDKPNFEANLLAVSISILLESGLPVSTKEQLQVVLDRIENGESFTSEETKEVEDLIKLAESEIEAANILTTLDETAAQDYLFAVAEKAVNL